VSTARRICGTYAALAFATFAYVARSPLGAQTIRRDDIERAGWNRISELVDGAVGWGRASVDGFTYSLSPDRLPAAGQSMPGMPDVIVLVDGQRVAADVFGMQLLELLPISIGQVDSVIFTRGPVMVAGRPAARGVISIFSRRPHRGLNAELTYQHGDESGDPGPYRYTTLSSPNVEKLGPFAHGDLGWAGERWEVDGGVHVASLNETDTIIVARFPPGTFSQLPQDVLAVTPTARAAVTAFGGRHELIASYGDQRGLLFIPTRRSQQSLRLTTSHVGVDGSLVARRHTIAYDASTSSVDASELASPLAFTVGHSRRNMAGSISASHPIASGTLTLGALGDWWTMSFEGRSGSRSIGGGGPFVRWLVPVSRGASIDATSTLVFDGRTAGSLDFGIGTSVRVDSLTSVRLNASRTTAHPSMDGTWVDAAVLGYDLTNRMPTFAATDLAVTRAVGSAVEATIGGRAERVTRWATLRPPRLGSLQSTADSSQHDANLFTARVRVETTGRGVWQGSLEYDHTSTLGVGEDSIGAMVGSTPANDLRAQLSASPVRDFRLSGIVSLTDGSRWSAFVDSTGAVPTVPPIRRLDASMEKWMWQRRLRVQLVYRNILNEAERYHPFGAQWNLRWHLSASLTL
jgi:hypothetical protein